MIELTLSDAEGEGVEDGEGTNTGGRIGPSKMSTHSLTLSALGVGAEEILFSGDGGSGGVAVVEVMGNILACLETEDE